MLLRRIPRRIMIAVLALAACAAMVVALRVSDRVAPGGSFPDPCALLSADEVTAGFVDPFPRLALAGNEQARPRRVHCTYSIVNGMEEARDPRLELAATGSGGCRPDGAVGPREIDVSGSVGRLDRDDQGSSRLVFCRDGMRVTLTTGSSGYLAGQFDTERVVMGWASLVMSRWDDVPRVDGEPVPLPEPLGAAPAACELVEPRLAEEVTGSAEGIPVGEAGCRWIGERGLLTLTAGHPLDRRQQGVSMQDSAIFELGRPDEFGAFEVDVPGAVALGGTQVGIGGGFGSSENAEGDISIAVDGFLVRISVSSAATDPVPDVAATAREVAIDVVENLRR